MADKREYIAIPRDVVERHAKALVSFHSARPSRSNMEQVRLQRAGSDVLTACHDALTRPKKKASLEDE